MALPPHGEVPTQNYMLTVKFVQPCSTGLLFGVDKHCLRFDAVDEHWQTSNEHRKNATLDRAHIPARR